MSTYEAAVKALTTNPNFRFTIRSTDGNVFRKNMRASRFLAKRNEYMGHLGVRVDVSNVETGSVQTWDIALTRRFWA